MRIGTIICLALLSGVGVSCQRAMGQEEIKGVAPASPLETTKQQASYAIGLNIARGIKEDGLALDTEALLEGIRTILSEGQPRLSPEECNAALSEFVTAQRKSIAQKNLSEGKAFLDANRQKEGVVTLPSGLQYMVLKSGKGPTPQASDTVRTHYHGTLIDGTVFDSSVVRNEPVSFPVGGVIRGWTEALQKMKVGDKWKLFVPSELAYGANGAGNQIGPHAVLIFEVELLAIE